MGKDGWVGCADFIREMTWRVNHGDAYYETAVADLGSTMSTIQPVHQHAGDTQSTFAYQSQVGFTVDSSTYKLEKRKVFTLPNVKQVFKNTHHIRQLVTCLKAPGDG